MLVGFLVYVNQVGLPNFIKRPVLKELRARGIDLQFSRLRWRWYHGIVAENVLFGRADEPLSPKLSIAEVQIHLNAHELSRFHRQIDSVVVRKGRLVWPVNETNTAPRQLTIESIQTDVRFLPGDQWSLDNFKAEFAGGKIQLSGLVNHASAALDWKLFQAPEAAPSPMAQTSLRQVAEILERIKFTAAPELRIYVEGDARDLSSFGVRLMLSAPGANTPWGTVTQGRLTARLFPATNLLSQATVTLEAANAQSRWANATNFQITMHFTSYEYPTNLVRADLTLKAADARSRWAAVTNLNLLMHAALLLGETNLIRADATISADRANTRWATALKPQATAHWIQARTNPVPLSGDLQFRSDRATRPEWGSAGKVQLAGQFLALAEGSLAGDPAWGWWTNLAPYAFNWTGRLAEVKSHDMAAAELISSGNWRAPELVVTNLQVIFDRGQVTAAASLDVATRALRGTLDSTLDPNRLVHLLPPSARQALTNFSWQQPPALQGEIALMLPPWTQPPPDWGVALMPSLSLRGGFAVEGGGAFRALSFTSARSHISYSNQGWHLTNCVMTRPEGGVVAEFHSDDQTRDFYARLDSTMDPKALRPLLPSDAREGLDLITFVGSPPVLSAELWGRWGDPDRIGFQGQVAITNFTFRNETASGLQAAFAYTNRSLLVTSPRLQRGEERLSADGLVVDFPAMKLYLTNGVATADAGAITRAIGPTVAEAIEPYHFGAPPSVRAYGTIPLRDSADADIHFDVEGGPLHWLDFNFNSITGKVHWVGLRLMLDDIHSEFYGGKATAAATIYFHTNADPDFQFTFSTTNASLHHLMTDLSSPSNHLEGALSGNLEITQATVGQWRSVAGHGNLAMRDGLIWEIPLFGRFSPLLDAIAPGLGSSRVSAATCKFDINKGVIHTDDLDMRANAMRLDYRGTVDLQQQVDAKVEAKLLRDVWVVGPLISNLLLPLTTLFEYKVTGSLSEPKTQPLYLWPKILLIPFHPLRSIRHLFPEDKTPPPIAPPATDAPPAGPE